MKYILYIVLALVILLVMVLIHELGHYTVGKILKFKINEFAVGFGPKLISKTKKSGEVFSLRLVPLGGFCAFEGESESPENPGVRGFVDEKPWKRLLVFLAGPMFNLLSAVIFSFIFILCIGYATPSVVKVYTDANAAPYSVLQTGDTVLKVDGRKISVMKSYEDLISRYKEGDVVTLTILRGGETLDVQVEKQHVVSTDINDKGEEEALDYYGFGFQSQYGYRRVGAGYALAYSVPFTGKMAWSVLGVFGKLITGQLPLTSITGPVGTISTIAGLASDNWRNILILLPLIAANLGIFNLLPIPALDGSKIVFTVIEWIRGKPVNRKVETMIHFVGIIALFAFVILVDLIGMIVRW